MEYYVVSPSEEKKAVQYLFDNFTDRMWEKIDIEMMYPFHFPEFFEEFSHEMNIGSLLRKGGFNWEPEMMNAVCGELVEKTAKKKQAQERKKAVQYLIDNIPKETWEEVVKQLKEMGTEWYIFQHHDFGMGVRNLLREGGFDWGPIEMDECWVELVKRAIRRKFGKIDFPKSREIDNSFE